jgi:[protein-PII] uridylyltransferase
MADLVRSLTRLFHWGAVVASPEISYGPDTAVARRLRGLFENHALAEAEGEALRQALLPPVKQFIGGERVSIEAAHRQGTSGLDVVGLHTDLVDAIICQLFRLADSGVRPDVRERTEGCAIVALGGYGRRELNPASDVDVMFLYPRQVDEYVRAVLNHVLYFLWDLGFTVGHSCRSLADAARMMETDLTARTSMLEARFLAGQPTVFAEMQARMWRGLQGRRAQQYIAEKLEEQGRRHQKYGGSVYLQEPNVKEGPGGLRDFHVAVWVARARHRLADLADLSSLNLLTPVELGQCVQALDFLLRVRSALHYLQAGKHDVLSLAIQVPVAASLGFCDGPK